MPIHAESSLLRLLSVTGNTHHPPPPASAAATGLALHDEAAVLRLEIEALRLANAALESQLLAGSEQAESMFVELERQRNALRDAHGRERALSAFA